MGFCVSEKYIQTLPLFICILDYGLFAIVIALFSKFSTYEAKSIHYFIIKNKMKLE